MRILITGINGFAGRHLAAHLAQAAPDADVHGTVFTADRDGLTAHLDAPVHLHTLDLRDEADVTALFETVRPDHVYHLAAWAEVGHSFDRPWATIENNVRAQANLIFACIRLNMRPRTLVVTSGEVYGGCADDGTPPNEDTPFQPANPYSVSKITQDMLALQYTLSHGLPIIRARPFNHIGPGQCGGFVAPDFALQIAEIEAGLREPILHVGDLSAERDFTDVRDMVRAYALLMKHGQPGQAYNIASGETVRVQHVLDTLIALSRAEVTVRYDAARFRPAAVRRSTGDITRLVAATGWKPRIALSTTLRDLLDWMRARIAPPDEQADGERA